MRVLDAAEYGARAGVTAEVAARHVHAINGWRKSGYIPPAAALAVELQQAGIPATVSYVEGDFEVHSRAPVAAARLACDH